MSTHSRSRSPRTARGRQRAESLFDARVVLQEAVSNAVLHGNLHINGKTDKRTRETLARKIERDYGARLFHTPVEGGAELFK